MAIDPATRYPGTVDAPTTQYPWGAARNIQQEDDGTGTPWEEGIANDIFGLFQALLSQAGYTPTNTPDNAEDSQYFDAIKKIFGRVNRNVLYGNFVTNTLALGDNVTLGPDEHGHDGWRAGAGGAEYHISVDENGYRFPVITAGSLLQQIEAQLMHTGGTWILTWFGDAQGRINTESYGDTETTATLPPNTIATVEFGTGTFLFPQFEPGSVPTLFEQRSQQETNMLARRHKQSFGCGTPGVILDQALGWISVFLSYTDLLDVANRTAHLLVSIIIIRHIGSNYTSANSGIGTIELRRDGAIIDISGFTFGPEVSNGDAISVITDGFIAVQTDRFAPV